ncbi:MAG: DeoR family transcriptional regulator [Aliidongia sp.]
MRSKERRAILLDALRGGEADVEALARRFDVSASTVRRDLQLLSNANAIKRTRARREPERATGDQWCAKGSNCARCGGGLLAG